MLLPKDWKKNFLSLLANKADLAHFLSKELCQAPEDKELLGDSDGNLMLHLQGQAPT